MAIARTGETVYGSPSSTRHGAFPVTEHRLPSSVMLDIQQSSPSSPPPRSEHPTPPHSPHPAAQQTSFFRMPSHTKSATGVGVGAKLPAVYRKRGRGRFNIEAVMAIGEGCLSAGSSGCAWCGHRCRSELLRNSGAKAVEDQKHGQTNSPSSCKHMRWIRMSRTRDNMGGSCYGLCEVFGTTRRWQPLCKRDDDIEMVAGGAIFARSDYLSPGLGERWCAGY